MICKHLPVKKIGSTYSNQEIHPFKMTQPITREELVRELEALKLRCYLNKDMTNELETTITLLRNIT